MTGFEDGPFESSIPVAQRPIRFVNDETLPIALITADGSRLDARVLGESFVGLHVRAEHRYGLSTGQPVEVEYLGAPLRAVVRHIQPRQDGSTSIRLKWHRPS